MKLSFRSASAVLALTASVALAMPVQATSLVIGSFLTPGAPNQVNDFENIGPWAGSSGNPAYSGAYTQGGITVQHFGGDQIVTTYQAEGNYSWYEGSGRGGYTDIKLASGKAFSSIQFDLTTNLIQPIGAGYPFFYQLLLNGNVVGSGNAGSLCDTIVLCFNTYGFTGGGFDEVRLQADPQLTSIYPVQFDPNLTYPDVLVVDSIIARAVPEPASWAMMIAGLGAVGGAMRQRRRVVARPV